VLKDGQRRNISEIPEDRDGIRSTSINGQEDTDRGRN